MSDKAELPCPENDPLGEPGVLLSDEIERYVKWFKLIDPFDKQNNLKPASYRLTVGDEYAVGGITAKISSDLDTITIPPFEIAIIKTNEKINMPRFLIARWNIRVTRAYQGLIWVGGPQVDPGYVGHLFCPIWNLSDTEVILRRGDAIATIDFIRTTTFKKGKSAEFKRPAPGRQKIGDYEPEKLKSALITFVKGKIVEIDNNVDKIKEKTEKELGQFNSRIDSYIVITITAISIIVAAILIIATSIKNTGSDSGASSFFSWWLLLSNIFSIFAIYCAYRTKLFGISGEAKKIEPLYKLMIILLFVMILLQVITLAKLFGWIAWLNYIMLLLF